jgi:hypothetical protein
MKLLYPLYSLQREKGNYMDWYEQAIPLRKQGLTYREIAEKLNKSEKTVESRFYREQLRGNINKPPVKIETNLQEAILKDLQKECDITHLCTKYKQSVRVIKATIEDLQDTGYGIVQTDNTVMLNKTPGMQQNNYKEDWKGNKIIRFGLIGDTHLCSMAQQMTHLNTYYDICEHEGIETIYHDGDLVDGDDVYPGHIYEVHVIGGDGQKKYAVKNYPQRKNIVTKCIGGNHDLKWFTKGGFDVVDAIARERSDIEYLGQYAADIELTPNCKLRLEHPMGKPAYAISYKTQRKIDNMRGGMKPNILSEGHYHYSDYFFRRNVHAICTPSFQGPTKFSTRLGLENDNGGWIIEINVNDEGHITKFTPSYYPFYKVIEHDY